MYTAEVYDKLAVNVEPEVVVARELEDDVVIPVVLAVRRLDEARLELHAVEIVRALLNQMKPLILSRV